MVPFAALLHSPSPALAQLAGTDFTVLGGSAVTCTDSVINGDAGVALVAAFTQTNCTVTGTVHVADAVALAEYNSFLAAYTALGNSICAFYEVPLGGASLLPGVYCYAAAVTETGTTLTLDGSCTDEWIFLIGTSEIPTLGSFTGTNFTVVNPPGCACGDNNVYWWTYEAATLTDSVFLGSILAGTSITTTDTSLDGQALAKAAVTLTDTSVCGPPPHPPIQFHGKVTGGGQIPVPNPDSEGRATFGFNAKGKADGTATGQFNYVNHVTGLHVNGPVDSVVVSVTNPDGSPKTVRFAGTCGGSLPACSFIVTVEDNGEPGTSDQFGITVTGGLSEATSQRVISKGNIQFHK